mmetsp:Transcript_25813/g.65494  ORF Transcript_25813/g.65494 Transcript_25813/m.65494 type:complete len:206 (-) Transcript_25813:48-665(-)
MRPRSRRRPGARNRSDSRRDEVRASLRPCIATPLPAVAAAPLAGRPRRRRRCRSRPRAQRSKHRLDCSLPRTSSSRRPCPPPSPTPRAPCGRSFATRCSRQTVRACKWQWRRLTGLACRPRRPTGERSSGRCRARRAVRCSGQAVGRELRPLSPGVTSACTIIATVTRPILPGACGHLPVPCSRAATAAVMAWRARQGNNNIIIR